VEPEVRYCTTTDGVRIAYAVAGQGTPIVWCIDPMVSHVQLEWSQPSHGHIQGEAGRHNTLVRLDFRGSGLSDRVMPKSLDEMVLDIEAVVARTGFEKFALVGTMTSSQAAILFAARHPDLVTHLVLIDGYAKASEFSSNQQVQAFLAAAKLDWTLATEAIGFVAFGPGKDANKNHGEFVRACVGREFFEEENLARALTFDASAAAQTITAPTLVIKHASLQIVTMEMTRDLVARIPNAQLAVVEGWWLDSNADLIQRVLTFINGEASPKPAAAVELPSGMTAIFFADIADSTALTERLGDKAFRGMARDLDATLRAIIREHSGTCIDAKTLGDGVLATFASAAKAIEAALACGKAGATAGLPLHLGLHAGDVIREENNVFGGAVNIAARISGLSAPGELLVSDTIRSLARTSAGVAFEDRGEQSLKGVGEPVRVFAVRQA
jgi:class 3 adenylate cyclase